MNTLYDSLLKKTDSLSLVGLGYVGMPIAVAFAKKLSVIGFDINAEKIALYRAGVDPTHEVGDDAIAATSVEFTSDEQQLRRAKFHIVAVPTPVNMSKTPDLAPVVGASTVLGRNLTVGSVVVYESTVYPGVTENVCVPILERESGLKCGVDFKVGYSPERINPGDKQHRLENIVKIVSGIDAETLETVAKVYELVIEAGVHRAPCIKVAEACKVVENSQRDINIAFMNELAMIFHRMGIDTSAVIDAMNTKWNAAHFTPGLVGGHCIGVDPYYLIYAAEAMGYHSEIVSAGRKVNDSMGVYVADAAVKEMILVGKAVRDAKVVILGVTFKENCPDTRNSKVVDILMRLREYGVNPVVVDPVADAADAKRAYGLEIVDMASVHDADCVILAVAHEVFKHMTPPEIEALFGPGKHVLLDVKGVLRKTDYSADRFRFWQL